MGQGALSKPVVQWWLSLSSSRNARSSNGCQKKAIPGEVNSMAHDRHTRSATPRLYLPAHTTARPLHTPMRLPGGSHGALISLKHQEPHSHVRLSGRDIHVHTYCVSRRSWVARQTRVATPLRSGPPFVSCGV